MIFYALLIQSDHTEQNWDVITAPDLDDAARIAIDNCPDDAFVAGVVQGDVADRCYSMLAHITSPELKVLP